MKKYTRTLADWLLAILLVAPGILLFALNMLCSGWNENTGMGSCLIPLLDPLYGAAMNAMLFVAFLGGIVLLPIILVLYVTSTIDKIRSLVAEKGAAFKNNPFGFVVWIIATLFISMMFIAPFVSLYVSAHYAQSPAAILEAQNKGRDAAKEAAAIRQRYLESHNKTTN